MKANKRNKLISVLRRISDTPVADDFLPSIYYQLEKNKPSDTSPLQKEISELKERIASLSQAILNAPEIIKSPIYKELESLKKVIDSLPKEIPKKITDDLDTLSEDIKKLQKDFKMIPRGGGSMPRQWQINGSTIATRYSDLNFVTSGWVATHNDTTKKTDITISGIGAPIIPTGTIDGSNTIFVFPIAPTYICVDQGRFMQKISKDGTENWTGTTSVSLLVAPTFDIFGL